MDRIKNKLRQIGPSIIVAAVVLGPGSITASTKVGAAFNYSALWLLFVLLALLIGVASLAAYLGATQEKSLCQELSSRLGPWAGWVIGIAFFLIVAGFQSGNNMAVIAGIEPLLGAGKLGPAAIIGILLVINASIIAILYFARDLYKQVERIMKVLVLLMLAAFLINFFVAKPSVPGIIGGLVPDFSPFRDKDQFLALMALIGTTFSVAGAFYQGYLVREKGWDRNDVKAGLFDSIFGMCVLVGVTAVIMITSAATFYDKVSASELSDAGKMSAQLKGAFGAAASWIFCFGFLAGAFSSFLVNAMIGGNVFSDGIGKGATLESNMTKHLTSAALLIGMAIGIASLVGGFDRTDTIVVAQASTVIGGPAVVAALLFLGWRAFFKEDRKPPLWTLILTSLAMALTVVIATTTAKKVVNYIVATDK